MLLLYVFFFFCWASFSLISFNISEGAAQPLLLKRNLTDTRWQHFKKKKKKLFYRVYNVRQFWVVFSLFSPLAFFEYTSIRGISTGGAFANYIFHMYTHQCYEIAWFLAGSYIIVVTVCHKFGKIIKPNYIKRKIIKWKEY